MNKTIFKYIFLMQLRVMIFVSISIFFLILLFDFAEVSRKFPITNIPEMLFAIKISFLRSPSTWSEILHYLYFVTATFSLWSLSKSHQLTILKSAGKSPQQILLPFCTFAFCSALLWLFGIHPLGLLAEKQYKLEISECNDENKDIWIDYTKNNQMIFIKKLRKNEINGLCIFSCENSDRMFAESAHISQHKWLLKNVVQIKNGEIYQIKSLEEPLLISSELIRILSNQAKTQDIFSLYNIYRIQQKNSVNLKSYEIALHKLLANCMSFILFSLIAAVICFPINRYKTKTSIAIKVISSAMFLRFANNILEPIAFGGAISPQLACWAVVLIMLFSSVAILVWKEA